MGEYARVKATGDEVKIGTCESMYYLRFEDRAKVSKLPNSLDAATCENLFWRLPFPDEDNTPIGGYDNFNRGQPLIKTVKDRMGREHSEFFTDNDTADDPGNIQLHHASGLLLNVPCYHGAKLPEVSRPMGAFWNGKGYFFELAHVKNVAGKGIMPVVRCRHCGQMWRYEWAEILPYIQDEELRARLSIYSLELAA